MVLACVEEWKVSALREVALESRGIAAQLRPCFWVCSLSKEFSLWIFGDLDA